MAASTSCGRHAAKVVLRIIGGCREYLSIDIGSSEQTHLAHLSKADVQHQTLQLTSFLITVQHQDVDKADPTSVLVQLFFLTARSTLTRIFLI